MKYIYYVLGLALYFSAFASYAAPPYIGVSVGENFAFTNQACLSTSKKVLQKNGFKKTMLAGDNVFAAFNTTKNYKYKAVVRCIENQNVFVVAVVANSTKTIKAKAQNLRLAIQKHFSPAPTESSPSPSTKDDIKIVTSAAVNKQPVRPSGGNFAKTWQDSLLGRSKCLERGETALRNSGFARNFEIDFEKVSLSGFSQKAYQGTIRCLPEQKIILFQVKGKSTRTAQRLLEVVQLNF